MSPLRVKSGSIIICGQKVGKIKECTVEIETSPIRMKLGNHSIIPTYDHTTIKCIGKLQINSKISKIHKKLQFFEFSKRYAEIIFPQGRGIKMSISNLILNKIIHIKGDEYEFMAYKKE